MSRFLHRAAFSALLLALAGCATSPRIEPTLTPPPVPAAVPAPSPAPAPSPTPVAPVDRVPEAVPEWTRIRDGFQFAQCERDRVRAAMRAYLRSPERLTEMLARAMPLLLLVRDELKRHALPLEYVFLPMIESAYVAVPSVGNRPAGMWQIMPVTAKGLGLAIEPGYDARLDAARSTRAAVLHLSLLAERFDRDWRLATMAYNAGEFRLRRAIRGARFAPHEAGHERLALAQITHTHLARLEAWACIVREAGHHAVRLPEIPDDERLVEVVSDTPIDFSLAAALARAPLDQFRRDNPAHRGGRIAANRPLLIRARELDRYQRLLSSIPVGRRVAWTRAGRTGALAAAHAVGDLEAAVLVELNEHAAPDAWLAPAVAPDMRPETEATVEGATRHIVRSGESLWLIARRHGLSIGALCALNGLDRGAVLRPGLVLELTSPRGSPRP